MRGRVFKKKYAFSLLEVTIGLVLATILLGALFNNYYYLMKANSKLQAGRDLIHNRSVFILRLNQIWNSLPEKNIRFATEISHTSSSPQTILHFFYNNGLDYDPNFCNEIEGVLHCNQNNQFCLLSKGKNHLLREEVLWKKGGNYAFSFFDPEKKLWVSEWKNTTLPPLLKISFDQEEFIFSLTNAHLTVEYS